MKKLLVILFLASFGLGFTLNDGEGSQKNSLECPYLNRIQNLANDEQPACPYLRGLNKEESVCPYLDSRNTGKDICPYLNGTNVNESDKQVIFENQSI